MRLIRLAVVLIVAGGRPDRLRDLVADLAERKGGKVTGLTTLAPELYGKRLELLTETGGRIR